MEGGTTKKERPEKGDDEEEEEHEENPSKKSRPNDNDDANLSDWLDTVHDQTEGFSTITMVFCTSELFEQMGEEGLGDEFQVMCIPISKREERDKENIADEGVDDEEEDSVCSVEIQWTYVCGPGPTGGFSSCEEATDNLWERDRPIPIDNLYILPGHVQKHPWDEFGFQWKSWVNAARKTKLAGPWTRERILHIMKRIVGRLILAS